MHRNRETTMVRTETIEHVLCDVCGREDATVRRYHFSERQFDGHRHDYVEQEIDLCDVCGREIYPYVKNWVEDARRRRNVRNSRDVQA